MKTWEQLNSVQLNSCCWFKMKLSLMGASSVGINAGEVYMLEGNSLQFLQVLKSSLAEITIWNQFLGVCVFGLGLFCWCFRSTSCLHLPNQSVWGGWIAVFMFWKNEVCGIIQASRNSGPGTCEGRPLWWEDRSVNEINKPLHSNGHLPNITHVGGSHNCILPWSLSPKALSDDHNNTK
jgi:hypothetical protein